MVLHSWFYTYWNWIATPTLSPNCSYDGFIYHYIPRSILFCIGYACTVLHLSHACMAFTSRADLTVRQHIVRSLHIPVHERWHLSVIVYRAVYGTCNVPRRYTFTAITSSFSPRLPVLKSCLRGQLVALLGCQTSKKLSTVEKQRELIDSHPSLNNVLCNSARYVDPSFSQLQPTGKQIVTKCNTLYRSPKLPWYRRVHCWMYLNSICQQPLTTKSGRTASTWESSSKCSRWSFWFNGSTSVVLTPCKTHITRETPAAHILISKMQARIYGGTARYIYLSSYWWACIYLPLLLQANWHLARALGRVRISGVKVD